MTDVGQLSCCLLRGDSSWQAVPTQQLSIFGPRSLGRSGIVSIVNATDLAIEVDRHSNPESGEPESGEVQNKLPERTSFANHA
jgi:hypothetical protein